LSEILFPRDPKIRENNLDFNLSNMKNKLLAMGNEKLRESKKDLEDGLEARMEKQLKAIKEASIQYILKDYLYLCTDVIFYLFSKIIILV
jgi:hypothetical protein